MSDLTPTEEVILDALIARWRLGEQLWTFSKQLVPAARKLVNKGLVDDLGSITGQDIRLRLTDEGRKRFSDPLYDPPERRTLNVKVEVDTDDIRNVLSYHSNKIMPPPRGDSGMAERWLKLADEQHYFGETERYWDVISRMPTGLAWAYLKANEKGGVKELKTLLAAAGEAPEDAQAASM
jgi:hypothetical protein